MERERDKRDSAGKKQVLEAFLTQVRTKFCIAQVWLIQFAWTQRELLQRQGEHANFPQTRSSSLWSSTRCPESLCRYNLNVDQFSTKPNQGQMRHLQVHNMNVGKPAVKALTCVQVSVASPSRIDKSVACARRLFAYCKATLWLLCSFFVVFFFFTSGKDEWRNLGNAKWYQTWLPDAAPTGTDFRRECFYLWRGLSFCCIAIGMYSFKEAWQKKVDRSFLNSKIIACVIVLPAWMWGPHSCRKGNSRGACLQQDVAMTVVDDTINRQTICASVC